MSRGGATRFNSTAAIASQNPKQDATTKRTAIRAFIALGSNMGNRLEMLEKACQHIDQTSTTKVIRTSGLWETEPMYVKNQDRFLNGVCEIETTLEPIELLDQLQSIEQHLARVKIIDKGPRTIDLDILLYGDSSVNHERLTVPHELMLERDFVLRPLCELIPDEKSPDLTSNRSFAEQLSVLEENLASISESVSTSDIKSAVVSPVANEQTQSKLRSSAEGGSAGVPSQLESNLSNPLPLSPLTFLNSSAPPLTALLPSRKTRIMSILNLTPDSFSDGGVHQTQNDEYLHKTVFRMFEEGADIIDIGGESTRPGSEPLSRSEELRRILPAVRIACKLRGPHQAISIDTYHAEVADQALREGADIINDVTAGTLDPDMLPTVARHGCAVVLMHMRGTPQTMMEPRFGDYSHDIIATIGSELAARVHAAEAAGIRRWRILLDPGFGFSKNTAQNFELLRRLPELRTFPGLRGLPWVIGISRKRFIRTLLSSLENRLDPFGEFCPVTIGTYGALMAAVHGGADIVRVHDTGPAKGLALVGDTIWRQ